MTSSMGTAIKIVCFDLGGVLVRIHRTWGDVCRAAGFEVRPGSDRDDGVWWRNGLMDLYATGRITGEEWSERLSLALGGSYSPAEIVTIHDAVIIGEYAGVSEVIDAIHAAGFPTACLSNTTHAHWLQLLDERPSAPKSYPTVRSLKRQYASHLLGLAKPHQEIYRAFERETGMRGADILFFDDLGENVEGARNIGWNAVSIDPHRETAPQLHEHLETQGVL